MNIILWTIVMYSVTYRDIEVITNVNMARNFSFYIQFSSFCPFTLQEKVQLKDIVRQLLLIVVKGLVYVN